MQWMFCLYQQKTLEQYSRQNTIKYCEKIHNTATNILKFIFNQKMIDSQKLNNYIHCEKNHQL